MNLTYFYPQKRGNVQYINNSPSISHHENIIFVAKTSNTRNFFENIRSDIKRSQVPTLSK